MIICSTGGIGPTHDDITVDAIATALGVSVVIHPAARAILERYYETRGGINEGRLRMARVPEGADLIPNKKSGAPGIKVKNIFIMAGVPYITAGMLDALTDPVKSGLGPLKAKLPLCFVKPKKRTKLVRSEAILSFVRAQLEPISLFVPLSKRNWMPVLMSSS